jgi:hypothetical protein
MLNKDIVDKLNNAWEWADTVGIDILNEERKEAADTITNLRNALHRIGYDYVELSYEKVQWQYHEHMKIAKKAYQESFPKQQPAEKKPLDNNF